MAEPTAPQADGDPPIDVHDPETVAAIDRYWRANLRLMLVLLVVWFVAGLGCGVLFADALHDVKLGGFPLGFWFAQQGSIVVFVLVVLAYAVGMSRLDRRHHRDLEAIGARRRQAAAREEQA